MVEVSFLSTRSISVTGLQKANLMNDYPKPKILIVDDEEIVARTIEAMIRSIGYDVEVCLEFEKAINRLRSPEFGIALIDIQLNTNSGFDVLQQVIGRHPDLHVIMISGYQTLDFPIKSIREGASGYLYKPVTLKHLKDEILRVTEIREKDLSQLDSRADMAVELEARTREVLQSRGVNLTFERLLIASLCRLAEFRDPDTGDHIHRMAYYSVEIAKELANNPKYSRIIDQRFLDRMLITAPLHDIGKAGISDAILLKPGKLTTEEFEKMKEHTVIGYNVLKDIIDQLGHDQEVTGLIFTGMDICRSHHERWDGTGYPDKLAADKIPLVGRILSIADVYDALSFPRVYRPFGLSHDDIKKMIVEGSGTQFDPDCVEAFLRAADTIKTIRNEDERNSRDESTRKQAMN